MSLKSYYANKLRLDCQQSIAEAPLARLMLADKLENSPVENLRLLPARLVANDNRLQHACPVIGAVDIAGAQGTPFQIAELVEQE